MGVTNGEMWLKLAKMGTKLFTKEVKSGKNGVTKAAIDRKWENWVKSGKNREKQ